MKPKKIVLTNNFQKDLKKIARSGRYSLKDLEAILDLLQHGTELPKKHRNHILIGEWDGYRECHIQPDWLLIYSTTEHEVILVRTGSHSKLFG
jgi:mRNA interferase YafQ